MRKVLKIIGYIIGSILLLLALAIVYLNTPSGQNFVRGKAEAFLRNKLKTEVRIGHLGYGLPKYIVLDNVFFADQAKDTLLSVGELKIDLNMLALIHKEVDVQELLLRGVHSHIYRNMPDTNYNFTYIITAFVGNKPADTTKKKDTSSSSLKIDLDRVLVDDIHFRMDDYTGGMRLALNLDHLDLHMKKLDLDKMIFHIRSLAVAGLNTAFSQDTSYLPVKPHDTTETKLQLIADNVDLRQIGFKYDNNLNKFLFGLQLGSLQLQLDNFVLQDNLLNIKKLAIDNTSSVLYMGKSTTAPAPIDTIVKKDSTEGWHVTARDVSMANVSYKMDNENEPRQARGIDYAHLDVKNIGLALKDLLYTSDTISGNLEHLTATDKSGVDVKELKARFNYNNEGAVLSGLYVQTPNTIIQNYLEVHYPSLAALKTRMQSLQVKTNIVNSIVGVKDILLFVPDLEKQDLFRKNRNGHVRLDAAITGFVDNLDIKNFYLQGLGSTEIQLNGRLSGLPDEKKLSYNLHIAKFSTSRSDVEQLVPAADLTSVRLPDKFGAVGQVSGTMTDYNTDLVVITTDGNALVKGTLGLNTQKYNMAIRTDKLNIGRIIKQDSTVGVVSANFRANGQGFDVKKMVATVDGHITSAYVIGYRYHDINLYTKVDHQKGDLDMMAADSNLRMQLNAHADFSGKYPAVKADIKLDSIDLQALKLYGSELRARGIIHADFPELNPDYPRGRFVWWQPVLNAGGKRYYLDSLYVISRPSQDTGQNIYVSLDMLQARVTGKTPLTKIGAIVEDHINRHYAFTKPDSTGKGNILITDSTAANTKGGKHKPKAKPGLMDTATAPPDYNLQLTATVMDKPLLHSLLPGLTSFDSIHVDGSVTPRNLALNVIMPEVVYSGTTVTNAKVQVRGTDSAFTYKINVDKLSQSQFNLWYTDIHGNLDGNTITTSISASDESKTEQFALKATMQQQGDSQIINLQPGLKLNYNTWEVKQPNRIVLAGGGYYVQDFEISNKGQSITANSPQGQPNTPLKIDFANFQLANLTKVISKNDTLLAGGVLGGSVTIEKTSPSMELDGNVQITGLTVLGDSLGDLAAQVADKDGNALATNVTLKGRGNDIALNGNYYIQPVNGNSFDMKLDVNALAMHNFEALAMHQIRNSSGFIRGSLKLQGTTDAPAITGELRTDNLATTISQLNAYFKMPNEKITFADNAINFNNFTINDSAGNKAVINGNIGMDDLTDPDLDLNIKATRWRALHSTIRDNKEFYGDLYLTTSLTLSGTPSTPVVDGNIDILKGTNLTIVAPDDDPQIESRKGIVAFVNMRDTGRGNYLVPKKTSTAKAKHKLAAGSDINVNLNVDKAAALTLVIDQGSGDFVTIKGEANLNASVAPGGTIGLTGIYELHSGAYQFNYNFIKRKFLIQDGSTISFAGDPVNNTTLDLAATYEANISPYDLVSREINDGSDNYYKQNLPFDVDLYIKGAVLQPHLGFDIQLPENKFYPLASDQLELIQSKLNQVRTDTSELNKQVFAVLILGRFVSDDPFSNGAGASLQSTALSSVSSFVGQQLNQAAGKLVKGVDLSVDLATTDDYTTGDQRQRTDLNLAASKRLLNDRLKLTIGNDFELEGPQTSSNQENNLVPSNLSADYLLSADGRYTIEAYRKAYDEGVLQGFVTETGLNFIVSLDYNHLKNALKNRRKQQKKMQAEHENSKADTTTTHHKSQAK